LNGIESKTPYGRSISN